MSEYVADCPRCNSRMITFDVLSAHSLTSSSYSRRNKQKFETFCICRNCNTATVFVLSETITDPNYVTQPYSIIQFNDSVNNHLNPKQA